MRKLPQTAPEIHIIFQEGKLAIKQTPRATGADMAFEQTKNRSKKGILGLIYITKKKTYVAMWNIIYHEMLVISNCLQITKWSYNPLPARCKLLQTETEERNVPSVIENKDNHFRKDVSHQILHNIMTQEVMTDEIQNQLLQVKATGTTAFEKLRKERFVEQSAQIFRTIHRTYL